MQHSVYRAPCSKVPDHRFAEYNCGRVSSNALTTARLRRGGRRAALALPGQHQRHNVQRQPPVLRGCPGRQAQLHQRAHHLRHKLRPAQARTRAIALG